MAKINEHMPADCRPIADLLSRIGDKWTILLLGELGNQRLRFTDLHRAIQGISQRMLTVTVRNLERDGLIIRTIHPTIPPKVEYELSESGRSLRCALVPVLAWVRDHRDSIEQAQAAFDRIARP